MKLSVSQIKKFIQLSSGVQLNSILPIIQFFKVENSTITKTNTHFFVQHKLDIDPKVSMLIDAKRLTEFIKDCSADEIDVTVEGLQGVLKEGKRVMKFQSEDIKFFPAFPDSEAEDEVVLESDLLMSIGVASKNVGLSGVNHPLDFVHLTGKAVFASDGSKFYHKKFNETPKIVLDTAVANIISQFAELTYYRKANYDFFKNNDTLYGFIKTEVKTPDISAFVMDECPAEYFEFNVAEFTGFCDTVAASSISKAPVCLFRGSKLSIHDDEDGFEHERILDTAGKYEPDMNFAPRVLGNFFKSLGCSQLRLSTSPANTEALSVWDTEDEDFFALIIGLQK